MKTIVLENNVTKEVLKRTVESLEDNYPDLSFVNDFLATEEAKEFKDKANGNITIWLDARKQ